MVNKSKNKKYSKKNITKKNITKKNKDICPIGLKPFEEEFSKLSIKKNYKNKQEFVKELLSKFAPHNIKPENDFYNYINYQWLKNVSLEKQQEYIVQIDDFRLAQDKVYRELNQIILDYVKNHNDKLSKNLKNFYKSVVVMNPKPYSRKLAFEAEKTVERLISSNNPWEILGHFNSDEMIAYSLPFVWSLNPDDKNTKVYCNYITPHQFNLLDINVYYDDGSDISYKKRYRERYNKYIKKVFDITLGKNSYNPQDVFDVEVDIFNVLGCTDVSLKEETYNKVYAEEALTKYGFDWKEFSKQLGFKKTPTFFITSSLNYLKCGSDLYIKNWNSSKWKTYWLFILLRRIVRITRGWEDILYQFKGDFERGQIAINRSDAVSSSLYMSVPFNTFLTNEYVKKYENPLALEYVKIMCEDLKLVFKKILERNTWLQPSTKKYALKKLQHLILFMECLKI